MRGIKFISLKDSAFQRHTADDWGLVMTDKEIGTPAVKEKITDLDDRDGILDRTDSMTGVPAYETRPLSFSFEYLGAIEEWADLFTEICNFLHGQRVEIHEPDDLNYYYIGRVSVGTPKGGRVKAFSVTVRADTWKYPIGSETVVREAVSASKRIILRNNRRPVSPTITTTGAVSFEFGGVNYSIAGAGTFRFPRFRLNYGENIVTIIDGSGELTFTYQEGAI